MVSVRREAGPGAKNLEVLLKGMKGLQGQVGWFPSAVYPDGTPVAYVATIQEFGSPANNIPPRSFMRTTITEKQQSWHKIAESGSKAVLDGRAQPMDVLEGICAKAQEDIAEKISNIYEPPLKPATIAARLNRRANKKKVGNLDKPLIDTGHLLETIHSQIEQK